MISRDKLRVRSQGYSAPAHSPNLDILLCMVIGTHWYTEVYLGTSYYKFNRRLNSVNLKVAIATFVYGN